MSWRRVGVYLVPAFMHYHLKQKQTGRAISFRDVNISGERYMVCARLLVLRCCPHLTFALMDTGVIWVVGNMAVMVFHCTWWGWAVSVFCRNSCSVQPSCIDSVLSFVQGIVLYCVFLPLGLHSLYIGLGLVWTVGGCYFAGLLT